MYRIDVEFVRDTELTLSALIQAKGVYIIWDGRAYRRPTYIGEGAIMARLNSHQSWLAQPTDVLVGVLGYEDTARLKHDGEVVEAALLACADRCDRYPTRNEQGGKRARIEDLLRDHATVRINIGGYDPLRDPRSGPLGQWKTITVRRTSSGPTFDAVPWNARPRLAA